jgi:hypothetical protein
VHGFNVGKTEIHTAEPLLAEGEAYAESVREQGAEEDIWILGGRSGRRVEMTQPGASRFVVLTKYNSDDQT